MQKRIITHIILILLFSATTCHAQEDEMDCDLYEKLIRKGNSAFKKKKHKEAINYYNLAAINCPGKSGEAYGNARAVFKKIKDNNESLENIVGSIYFYKEKYGLAVKRTKASIKWGFIDKKGSPQFDGFIYHRATVFNETDKFARVQILVEGNQKSEIIEVEGAKPRRTEIEQTYSKAEASMRGLRLNGDSIVELKLFIDGTYETESGEIILEGLQINTLPYKTIFNKTANWKIAGFNNNKFTSIPSEVLNSSCLNILDFSHNNLKEIPTSIKNVKQLVQLDLSNNEITVVPNEMLELTLLEYLSLANNNIKEIPYSITAMGSSLRTLNFSGNGIKKLPKELDNLSELEELYISDDSLMNIPNVFSTFSKLRLLDLSNNSIKIVPSHLFAIKSLKHLKLANNPGIRFENDFCIVNEVDNLDLSFNELDRLPICFNTSKVKALNLSGNRNINIEDLGIPTLEEITMNNVNLNKLPSSFAKCESLITIDLNNNVIDTIPSCLSELAHLSNMLLAHNSIRYFPDNIDHIFGNLKKLDLSHNEIDTLDIRNIGTLNELNLSSNKIVEIKPNFNEMSLLKILDLSNNPLNQNSKSTLRNFQRSYPHIEVKY